MPKVTRATIRKISREITTHLFTSRRNKRAVQLVLAMQPVDQPILPDSWGENSVRVFIESKLQVLLSEPADTRPVQGVTVKSKRKKRS